MKTMILVEDAEPLSIQAIEKAAKSENFSSSCVFRVSDKIGHGKISLSRQPGEDPVFLQKPARMGKILSQIKELTAETGKSRSRVIGSFKLDSINGELYTPGRVKVIRLTEKESKILETLAEAEGSVVSRTHLLDSVWAYASNIETHTLETHIYRLRQKIEEDPSRPCLLLTEEQGYRLAG